jgi:hypothetical protein
VNSAQGLGPYDEFRPTVPVGHAIDLSNVEEVCGLEAEGI